jgi:2-polyprenyl-3-methyl-5-hydroxy-6-metoxy-1,4-benzoquinol methylase
VLAEGYAVTAAHEATHWWFQSRRELCLRQVARAVAEIPAPGRRLRLLDYGCGTGFDLPHLASYGDVAGADLGTEPAAAARRDARFPIFEVPHELDRLRGRYDVVTAFDVLEHLPDDVDGLRTLASLLGPAGQIVVTVPAYAWLWSGEDVLSQHRRRYTMRALRGAVDAAGLVVRFASYFNMTILPGVAAVIWARRLFRRDWDRLTNLDAGGTWTHAVVRRLTSREARWIGDERLRLPAGTSLVARLARTVPAPA